MSQPEQCVVTLDLEGVLVPEIWIAVAERTGIDELRRTTRDEPDYDRLMTYRLDLLARHALGIAEITEVIGGLTPLPGAARVPRRAARTHPGRHPLRHLRGVRPPAHAPAGWPTLLCHRLVVDDGAITGYRLRMPDQKRAAVEALRSLNYRVVSAGDSYNDTAMLLAADAAFLIHAPTT
jgi:phosphoserine / homoserine phosphotransferase